MMGARHPGIRLTIHLHDEPGTLSRIGGEHRGVWAATSSRSAPSTTKKGTRALMIKVHRASQAALIKAMEDIGAEIVDVREN